MLTKSSSDKSNIPFDGKAKHADDPPGRKDSPVRNSVWQSLALRCGAIQTKLAIGQADDPYEREADRIADQVMDIRTSPSPGVRLSFSALPSGQVHRKCGECEDEEAKKLQRKEQRADTNSSADAPPIVHRALNSPGQPLAPPVRSFMEERFKSDFGQVRLHTDASAAESARAVNARAYTVGRDVVLDTGEYAPNTSSGLRLLAHELAHVTQQETHVSASRLMRQPRDLPATSSAADILFFPEPQTDHVRIGVMAHVTGGLVDASLRPTLVAIVSSGVTIHDIAARLLPIFVAGAAQSTNQQLNTAPPTVDELAQAIAVFNRYYLTVPSMTNFTVGLRLPLPVEIDSASGDFIVNPEIIRTWAGIFDQQWTSVLTKAPTPLASPNSADLETAVDDFLAANTSPLAQGIALTARVMTNPFEAVGMMTRLFRRLGTGAFEVAINFTNHTMMHEINSLASLIPGDAILRLLRAALSTPPSGLSAELETRRQQVLANLPGPQGWNPLIRADEAGAGGSDRLADQTFECGEFSVFIPAGARASTTNQVHVFFSAGGVIGAASHVEHHGLRGAADPNQWILMGVRGESGRRFTITTAQIAHCLQIVGRSAQIDSVRLSAHSRGNGSMAATLQGRLITPSLIDHVTVLDGSDFAAPLTAGLQQSRIPSSKVTAYFVTTGAFPTPAVQSKGIDPTCIRAIGYARLINDAVTTGRVPTLPPRIATLVGALALPPRGSFSTATPPPSGQFNINAFCSQPANVAALRDMRFGEGEVAHVSDLVPLANRSPYAFVEVNNLLNINDPNAPRTEWRSVSPGIYSHHLFVAEIAHELFE